MLERLKERVDAFQQRHAFLAFPYGVMKKFGDDRAGEQAALLAYYGFFSIFPLLLFAVTLMGMMLSNNPELQERILRSALAQFPIIGDQIRENVRAIGDSGVALFVGLFGALWAGLAGVKALQNAMDRVWDVPIRKQPGLVTRVRRGLLVLSFFGAFALATTGLSGIGAGAEDVSAPIRIATFLGSFALNVVGFLFVFKMLTVADVSWNDVAPGAAVAGFGWTVVLSIGNYYVGTRLKHASAMYGFFGVVIGLLSWMYLAGQITLFCAEINVVRKEKLWPRSRTSAPASSPKGAPQGG
ncbi:MAG: YihY/virulence factor BrkB family protein [Actinomycetota bacterium]